MKRIDLTQGYFALVDDEDYSDLADYKWHYKSPGYANRTAYKGRIKGKDQYESVLMHREIMKAGDNKHVDHINRNGLDNRKKNLRVCTHQQNMFNRGKFQSRHFKGVEVRLNGFGAYIKLNQKQYRIGTFPTAHSAALARDMWALEMHGNYADTNFKPLKSWLPKD